jgi:hypothetical protein
MFLRRVCGSIPIRSQLLSEAWVAAAILVLSLDK